ncbi:kinase-like domain, phloem protein 2-like protein [Tanacetum coccineum]
MESFTKEFEHLVVKLEDIKSATDNFDDSKVIGNGGFGKVYKGEVSHFKGRSMVAFKRLDRMFGQGRPEFWREIMMLSRHTHENLISLLGYCNEGGEMILVYEHACNGSLDRHLSSTTLTWTQRIKICLDAARGLSYLHEDKGNHQRVIHPDIKSSNILLDENWTSKVSDMGLAKIGPANQPYTALVTNIVGTLGYLDPIYLQEGILTKESDVYSFGVVLFEVLCGRVCFEKRNGKFSSLVHMWKKSCKLNKIDELILKDNIVKNIDPTSLVTFTDIALRCLNKSREARPTMCAVVEKLEMALKSQEPIDLMPKEYLDIVKAVVPPLIYRSVKELKVLLSKGVLINGDKTWLSITEKGEHIERISIEACLNLNEIRPGSLLHPSGDIVNSRFPGGRCYRYYSKYKARVIGQYLTPQISYTLNLVFRYKRDTNVNGYGPLKYKVDGEEETKVFIIYPIDMNKDGWFIAPLYQFTSQHKTADLQFEFQGRSTILLVTGFEFQPSEEKVQLKVFEEYQDIIEAASQSMFYTSLDELKQILSKGVPLHGYKTWFSLNEKGEHCELISIEDCLIPNEDFPSKYLSRYSSRYVDLKYKLRGEATTSTVYLATRRRDDINMFHMAELYQFTCDGSIVDLEIIFGNSGTNIDDVEGIMFQPLEIVEDQVSKGDKVENIQTISDSESDIYWEQKFPNDYEEILNLSKDRLMWTTKKELYSIMRRGFLINNGQEWFTVDKHGKKCPMLSARVTWVTDDKNSASESSHESRFGEVLVTTASHKFEIQGEIKSEVASPETNYESYLVYKLPQDQSTFEAPMFVREKDGSRYGGWYIYLVSPPVTPFIGSKLDGNNYNPLNRYKGNAIPQDRSDGWMEVKVWEFQTTTKTVPMHLYFEHPDEKNLKGLMVQGIELRPVY